MTVLVTGGAGFIGGHLVQALLKAGYETMVVDFLDDEIFSYTQFDLPPEVSFLKKDVRELKKQDLPENLLGVVHLAALGGVGRAARDPNLILKNNKEATAHIAELIREHSSCQKFILASSFSVYGANYKHRCLDCGFVNGSQRDEINLAQGEFKVVCAKCHGFQTEILPITTQDVPAPLETYGESKLAQEKALNCLESSPIDVNVLRFSSVYGSRMRPKDPEATILAKLAGQIMRGETVKLYEDGQQIRDWLFVSDLEKVILELLKTKNAPRLINCCTGQTQTLIDACSVLKDHFNSDSKIEISGAYRIGDMRHCLGNPELFEKILGRSCTPLKQGVPLAFKDWKV